MPRGTRVTRVSAYLVSSRPPASPATQALTRVTRLTPGFVSAQACLRSPSQPCLGLPWSRAGPCQCLGQRSSGPASEFNLAVSRCARVALGPMGRASVVSGRLNQPRGRAALCLGSPKSARDLSRIQVARVSPCLVSQVRHGRGPNQHGLFLGSPESRRRAFQVHVAARVALPVVAQVSPGLVSGR